MKDIVNRNISFGVMQGLGVIAFFNCHTNELSKGIFAQRQGPLVPTAS